MLKLLTDKRAAISGMKKLYFCDNGIRNIINAEFGDILNKTDNGAVIENFVLPELLRNLKPVGGINFYRTRDDAEDDFAVNRIFEHQAFECKYKTFEKPSHSKARNAFSGMEYIEKRYIINKNLNITDRGVKFLQGYLAARS